MDGFVFHGKYVVQMKGLTAVILLYETHDGTFWVPIPHDAIRLFAVVFYFSESLKKVFGYCSKRHKLEDVF